MEKTYVVSVVYMSYIKNGKRETVEFKCEIPAENAEIMFNKNVKTLRKSELTDWYRGGAAAIVNNGKPMYQYTSPGSTLSFD